MNSAGFQEQLLARAHLASVSIAAGLAEKLEAYYRLLATWNVRINLSGLDLSEPTPEAIDRLLIEPVVAAAHAPSSRSGLEIIDIGSGGGSPAIPFSLAIPGSRLVMVESRTKKSIFLREAARALELEGAEVLTSRFEALPTQPVHRERYDLLTVRAVSIDGATVSRLLALVRPAGAMFLFRGPSNAALDIRDDLIQPAQVNLIEPAASTLLILHRKMTN